jgi:hypothetical protein
MELSFQSLETLYDVGYISSHEDLSRDVHLVPKGDQLGSPFLNSYNIVLLKSVLNNFPNKLSYLLPFIKVQGSIATQNLSYSDIRSPDSLHWRAIWDHITTLYVYSAFIEKKDPWEHTLRVETSLDAFGKYDIKSFYDNFSISEDSSLDYYLLNNFTLPDAYVQKVFAQKELGQYFSNELLKIINRYKISNNNLDESFIEKIALWPSMISKTETMTFIEMALQNWGNSGKGIDEVRIATLVILFTYDCFYARLGLFEILKRAKILLDLFEKYKKHITRYTRANISLFFALGKLQDILKIRGVIKFYPDYLKLTSLSASLYDYLMPSEDLHKRWFEKGISRQNTEYIRIGVDDKKSPEKYSLKINAKQIGHISNLPPYLFARHIKELLLCNAELMNFTEKHLKIDPVVLYNDLKKANKEKHYNILGSQIFDEVLRAYESSVLINIIDK